MKKILMVTIMLFAVLTSGCISLAQQQAVPVSDTPHIIYVVYRNWHTSIVVEAKQLARYSPALAGELHGADYARVGWGDGDYFTGKSKTWGSATRALMVSGYSAVQLLTYTRESLNEIPADTRVAVAISERGLQQLVDYISASITLNQQGQAITLPARNLDSDAIDIGTFFKAKGHYNLFNNCNTWSGNALRQSGLPFSYRLTAQGVFSQAQQISRLQAEGRGSKPQLNY